MNRFIEPAFPTSDGDDGMRLRDWFAGQAMVALINNNKWSDYPELARLSYEVADAMLRHQAYAYE